MSKSTSGPPPAVVQSEVPEMKNPVSSKESPLCQVVAMPYPGRGHINPIINLCKQLVSRANKIVVTLVLTEEWLSYLSSEHLPEKIRLVSIPNVIPSEQGRAADINGFLEAVWTKMENPFELLLDQLEQPASVIIADSLLYWAVGVGNRRNIPVASFWPMSAMTFSIFENLNLLVQNGHCPVDLIGEKLQNLFF